MSEKETCFACLPTREVMAEMPSDLERWEASAFRMFLACKVVGFPKVESGLCTRHKRILALFVENL